MGSERPLPGLGGIEPLPVAEIVLSAVNSFGVDRENGLAAMRGLDSSGLPIVVALPAAALDAAIQALQSAKAALDAPESVVVTETVGFQAAPSGKEGFDGVLAMFNPGALDARCYALPLGILPAVITQLHDAGAAQQRSRKRLIRPT
jgi:hypothetical protein